LIRALKADGQNEMNMGVLTVGYSPW